MTAVFIDTVGLIAARDQTDQWHSAAASVFVALCNQKRPVVIMPQVLWECGNAAARRPYRQRVHALWNAFERDGKLI